MLAQSMQINQNLAVTRDKNFITMLNENKFPKFYRIIIGCASWAPGQIESEMLGSRTGGRSMWTNFPYTEDFMWNNQPVNQWNAGIEASANAKVTNYLNF